MGLYSSEGFSDNLHRTRASMAPSPAQRRLYNNFRASPPHTATERIVWLAPSPLKSPARDKTKKSARQRSSVFSFRARCSETEEPTSPKVSCVGRVRKSKNRAAAPQQDSFYNRAPPHTNPSSANGEKYGCFSLCCGHFYTDKRGESSSRVSDRDEALFPKQPVMVPDKMVDPNVYPNAPTNQQNSAFRRSNSTRRDRGLTGDAGVLPDHGRDPEDLLSFTGQPNWKPNDAYDDHSMAQPFDAALWVSNAPVKYKPAYEDLPSLQCSNSPKDSNLLVSFDVVPETWLKKNVEEVKPLRRSKKNARNDDLLNDDLLNALAGDKIAVNYQEKPSFVKKYSKPSTSSDPAKAIAMQPRKNPLRESLIDFIPLGDASCKGSQDHPEKVVGIEDHPIRSMHTSKRIQFEATGSPNLLEASRRPLQIQDSRHTSGKTKQTISCRLSGLGKGFQMPIMSSKNIARENDCSAHSRQSLDPNVSCAELINALVFVGYNINGQPPSTKKFCSSEEHLKCIYGYGNHLKWLKSDAQFIRSLSATTCRTVIQLQRCNSDPCRTSF